MIALVVALKDEAKPLIEYFKLAHLPEFKEFKIYKKDEVLLIISGVGKVKSAVATGYMLMKFKDLKAVINFGICGCGDLKINVGEMLLANKVVDEATGRSFFSDIPSSHNLREFTIHTYDKPVENQKVGSIGVDMEASGFFEGALKFVKADRIFAVKLVSDHLDFKTNDPIFVVELIKKHVKQLDEFVQIFKERAEQKTVSTLDKINILSKK